MAVGGGGDDPFSTRGRVARARDRTAAEPGRYGGRAALQSYWCGAAWACDGRRPALHPLTHRPWIAPQSHESPEHCAGFIHRVAGGGTHNDQPQAGNRREWRSRAALEPVPMRFITFPSILTLPVRPTQPGPCQARLPNGRQCRRPASRASGHHKCTVHEGGRDPGTARAPRPAEEAEKRVLDWLRGGRGGHRRRDGIGSKG